MLALRCSLLQGLGRGELFQKEEVMKLITRTMLASLDLDNVSSSGGLERDGDIVRKKSSTIMHSRSSAAAVNQSSPTLA